MKEKKVREVSVYIIDSHVLVRQMMISVLRAVRGIKVLGSTSGKDKEGVSFAIKKLGPDVIFFGIDQMTSVETDLFLEVRKRHPNLPVIVLTPRNSDGAEVAIFALKNGAVEFITIPERTCVLTLAKRHFLKRVVPAVRMVSRLNRDLSGDEPEGSFERMGPAKRKMRNRIELVVTGGGTGCVRSFIKLLSGFNPALRVPIVAVLHLPKYYTEALVKELDRMFSLKVRVATNGCLLLPGHIYIVPGGLHAMIKKEGERKQIVLHRGPREQRSRPSIDVLMRSASRSYPDKVLAVFLSGGGKDGLQGAKEIVTCGGAVFLESRESALLWDLPKKVSNLGISQSACASNRLAEQILDFISADSDDRSPAERQIEKQDLLSGQVKRIQSDDRYSLDA